MTTPDGGPNRGRPTMYSGVQMRSRLEADFAAWLDRQRLRWTYEPTCFAGPDGQWLPDFHLVDLNLYIELKPPSFMRSGEDATVSDLLGRMLQARLTDWSCAVALVVWEYGQQDWPAGQMTLPASPEWLTMTVSSLCETRGLRVGMEQDDKGRQALRVERVQMMLVSRQGWGRAHALTELIEQSGDAALIEKARARIAEKDAEAENLRGSVADA